MTYFAFLAGFIGLPLAAAVLCNFALRGAGRKLPVSLRAWPALPVLAGHVLLAVAYTTPWDNYLVATNVWWYDPALVTGVTFGYVPIEEYTFFVVQTLLVGFWFLALARLLPPPAAPFQPRPRLRWIATAAAAVFWLWGAFLLLSSDPAGNYLGLELVWALIPLGVQLAFGADILWHYRRLVAWTLLPAVLYLSWADALAIGAGTWTISPQQSFHILIAGVLPVEEFIFFLLTSALVVFGMTLMLARASHARAKLPAGWLGAVEAP